jgi:molecular chaperone DnaJ
MVRDYYGILGVDPDAGPEQIRSAYRRKAKDLHPDYFPGGSRPFRDVKEAYDVLGDAERRQCYDDRLARQREARRGSQPARPEPLRQRRGPVEPLVPARGPFNQRDPYIEMGVLSLFEELLWATQSDRLTRVEPQTALDSDFHVQVSLTQEQALYGGRLRVWIPVQVPCPACQGRGSDWFRSCLNCEGSGAVTRQYAAEVSLPAGIRDGDTGRVSLRPAGMGNVTLTLHVRVDGW